MDTVSLVKNNLPYIKNILKLAGRELVKIKKSANFAGHNKKNGTLITKADRRSQEIIIKGLKKFNWSVMSEENYYRDFNQKNFWALDPLDGTEDFVIPGNNDFCIMLGLLEQYAKGKSRPLFGIVFLPTKGEFYYAFRNRGAYYENKKGRVQSLCTSFRSVKNGTMTVSRLHGWNEDLSVARRLGVDQIIFRGSVGVKAGLIASGAAEFYMKKSQIISFWDVCAPQIIVEEAGGVFRDFLGNKIVYERTFKFSGLLVCNTKKTFNFVKNCL